MNVTKLNLGAADRYWDAVACRFVADLLLEDQELND